jgi:hypothetical protein
MVTRTRLNIMLCVQCVSCYIELQMCVVYKEIYICTNSNHQQMHKESFIINRNTLLHVSTLLGHLHGELSCYRYTKVALYS